MTTDPSTSSGQATDDRRKLASWTQRVPRGVAAYRSEVLSLPKVARRNHVATRCFTAKGAKGAAGAAAGIGGYKDGLYPVESMKTYDGMPKAMHKYAPPEVPLPRDAEAQKALLARATAVVQGAKPGLDPSVKAAIDAEFSSVATYARAYTVLVRKSGAATPAPQGPAPRAPGPEGEPSEQEEP